MKKIFREYHQFTDKEFKQLWENCLFVFDTNTLLNMYRYSRETVNEYFSVLNELKKKKQVWIPYQVGYEFYENRIDVISEYESSYDCILTILHKAKNDIETKYKDHPFLDLADIKNKLEVGLSTVDKQIKDAQEKHPKWIDRDDVLDQINGIFENSIGINYDEEKINAIKKEGKERYEKKIPPGYKDDKKPDDKKYGDLILWYQIIDKAIESKKPIILISGDVKEDWWLEKNGKRLMPLPQLKKEIFEKAGVDFHIYTADKFLEYSKKEFKTDIDKKTISEVRRMRELEEKRMIMRRIKITEREIDASMLEIYSMKSLEQFEIIHELMMRISQENIHEKYKEKLENLFREIRDIKNRIAHGEIDRVFFVRFFMYSYEIQSVFEKLLHSEELHPELFIKVREYLKRLEHLNLTVRQFV